MKYIDADKLIAEIERRIDSWSIRGEHSPAGQGKDTCESRVTELSDLLSFITSLQQEQSEVDLEKEIEDYWEKICDDEFGELIPKERETAWFDDIARHFYELRNRALEEAARHVYESWMGGTMDDVRRDMVELGKVIKARNKE